MSEEVTKEYEVKPAQLFKTGTREPTGYAAMVYEKLTGRARCFAVGDISNAYGAELQPTPEAAMAYYHRLEPRHPDHDDPVKALLRM